jgi:hypothetical protein
MRRSLTKTGALAVTRRAPRPRRARVANGGHTSIAFRGQAIIPTGTMFAGTVVGGLSSRAPARGRREIDQPP